jgi:hypothetical protein
MPPRTGRQAGLKPFRNPHSGLQQLAHPDAAGKKRVFGEWLSLVEHLVRDQGVGGSNPLSPTIFRINRLQTITPMCNCLPKGSFLASIFALMDWPESGDNTALIEPYLGYQLCPFPLKSVPVSLLNESQVPQNRFIIEGEDQPTVISECISASLYEQVSIFKLAAA